MADVSDVSGSILQAGLQQEKASSVQDNDHNRAVGIAKRAAQKAAQRENDVVGDDSEMTVNADGGRGGRGREFSETPKEEIDTSADVPTEVDDSGITTDEDGEVHLDLEA